MRSLAQPHKHIVAAFVLAVGFSIPALDFAVADEARVAELFAELQTADEVTTQALIDQISVEWSKSGSPAIDLLMQRGFDAREAGDPVRAVEHFTAAIDHAPDFAEAYNARAEAYYMTDDIGPAIQDLAKALELNPQHFGAQLGFAIILGELGRDQDALDLYRRVQTILPQHATVADAIRQLSVMLEGQTL